MRSVRKKLSVGFVSCATGAEGESSSEVFPRLAGQHWEYTAKQLENFKSGKRKSTAMSNMVAKLTPDEMVALGKYFEKKSAPREPAKDEDLSGMGKYIYPAWQQIQQPSGLRQLPWQRGSGHGLVAAPGRPVRRLH
jgi:cytochrome c553